MATKRRGARRNGNSAAWLRGFTTGLASGAIAAAAVYFLVLSPGTDSGVTAKHPPKATAKQVQAPTGPKPKFEFYTILPELEVPVPETAEDQRQAAVPPALQTPAAVPSASAEPPATSAPSAPTASADAGRYILQAGSSRNAADAERLRASLALQGMVARIQTVNINGETWHRIRVGPFASRPEADAAQRQLRSADINTMLLELRDQ